MFTMLRACLINLLVFAIKCKYITACVHCRAQQRQYTALITSNTKHNDWRENMQWREKTRINAKVVRTWMRMRSTQYYGLNERIHRALNDPKTTNHQPTKFTKFQTISDIKTSTKWHTTLFLIDVATQCTHANTRTAQNNVGGDMNAKMMMMITTRWWWWSRKTTEKLQDWWVRRTAAVAAEQTRRKKRVKNSARRTNAINLCSS